MAFTALMLLALAGALVIPIAFGPSVGALIAAHGCVLAVSVLIVIGTLRLNRPR